jgi:putative GTP pyrophosphokinase
MVLSLTLMPVLASLSLPRRIADRDDAIALDRLSLGLLVDCAEARATDDAIARLLAKSLGSELFFPDYLVRMLAAAGIETVADARVALTRHADRIPAMVTPYFAFSRATWGLSPDQMTELVRGYGLFFLAHAVVLDAPALGATPIDRLARLYRELDYPDDPTAARNVADALVAAFGR